MTSEEFISAANLLEQAEAQHRLQTGYGSATVRAIAQALRYGDLQSAQATWLTDGDKIATYPMLKAAVVKVLGCRLHHIHQCQNWICQDTGAKEHT